MDLFSYNQDSSEASLPVQSPVLQVSEFIEYINSLIGRKTVVVEGEVSSYKISQGKWVFFDLKEKDASITCFAMAFRMGARLEDGMKVRVAGTPRIHKKSGRFSLYVDSVELVGEGDLQRAFELTKKALEKEGLFDVGRKRPIKLFPSKIGVIASRESAAYSDFMRILNQRWGGIEILLYHVNVQGEKSVESILEAFEYFNSNDTGADVVVLTRGGGSLEDLQAFNSEQVARAVFSSKIPVVCGVGHEPDESLADYVADVRAATPTHAATLVVPDRSDILDKINGQVSGIGLYIDRLLEWRSSAIDRAILSIHGAIDREVSGFKLLERELHVQGDRFLNGIMQNIKRVNALERSLAFLNPRNVLKRGFAMVSSKGKVITKSKQMSTGDKLTLSMQDGDATSTVD